MNHPIKYMPLLLFLAMLSTANASSPVPIQELELDERNIYIIPVSIQRVTTISFPGTISAMDAALVTVDGKTPGLFQIAHKPGSCFFSVRSLAKDAVTNVNVRWNNKTYVLELQESRTPLLSLVFKHKTDTPKSSLTQRRVTPSALAALLDQTKAYPILKASHPEVVEGVDYLNYGENPCVMDYDDFEIRLEEVTRFNPQDTLVFKMVLRNKTDREIAYQPQGFSLRVGERLYPQSISDASGVMPPRSDTQAYFAVTGTPDGGRNEILVKNDFTILLTRIVSENTLSISKEGVAK